MKDRFDRGRYPLSMDRIQSVSDALAKLLGADSAGFYEAAPEVQGHAVGISVKYDEGCEAGFDLVYPWESACIVWESMLGSSPASIHAVDSPHLTAMLRFAETASSAFSTEPFTSSIAVDELSKVAGCFMRDFAIYEIPLRQEHGGLVIGYFSSPRYFSQIGFSNQRAA